MIEVTAAIIRKDNKILICQRAGDDECPMLWEFPGGKLEDGETLEQCIIREIKEELSLEIKVIDVYKETIYRYDGKEIHFTFFNGEIVGGQMTLNVHNDAKWVTCEQMKEYKFMPADVEIADNIM